MLRKSFKDHPVCNCIVILTGAIRDLVDSASPTDKFFKDGLVRGWLQEGEEMIFVDKDGIFEYQGEGYITTEVALRKILHRHFQCRVSNSGHS